MQDSTGAVATAKLIHDLVAIVKCDLVGGVLPANFLNRVKAAVNKTTILWKNSEKDFFDKWLQMAFQNNGRIAHRWANADNVPPAWIDLDRSLSGSTHPLDHWGAGDEVCRLVEGRVSELGRGG